MRMKLDRAIGWQTLFDESAESCADFDWILLVDETERNLGGCFRSNHGFETFAGIAADNAVDFSRWARPGQFQNAAAFFTRWD
ncbi:hypothetical protein D9M69_711660 [compost metagenome]